MKLSSSKDSSAKSVQAENHALSSLGKFGLVDGRPEAGIQKQHLDDTGGSIRAVMQRKEFDDTVGSGNRRTFSSNHTGMPDYLKEGIEGLSGFDLSSVRVHYNSGEPAKVGAHAYAQGHEIHLAQGQEKHLPHEAWHVVQQMQGKVKPVAMLNGRSVNNERHLESEADSMGARIAQAGNNGNVIRGNGTMKSPDITCSILQARWIDSGRFMVWDIPMDGRVWYYDPQTAKMAFTEQGTKMSVEVAGSLIWQHHGEWQKQGWGIEPASPDKGKSPPFATLVETGRRRWEELQKAGPGQLHEESQRARDWFFKNYYNTKPNKNGVESDYKFRPDSMNRDRDRGYYSNAFDFEEGRITADMNYALGAGERYYDPVTGNAERMSNSEILFQQWRISAEEQKKKPTPLRQVKRDHIAGDAWFMINEIRKGTGTDSTKDETFTPNTAGFNALLAIPNVVSSIWLIRDHGVELGIQNIASITILKNRSVVISFVPLKFELGIL